MSYDFTEHILRKFGCILAAWLTRPASKKCMRWQCLPKLGIWDCSSGRECRTGHQHTLAAYRNIHTWRLPSDFKSAQCKDSLSVWCPPSRDWWATRIPPPSFDGYHHRIMFDARFLKCGLVSGHASRWRSMCAVGRTKVVRGMRAGEVSMLRSTSTGSRSLIQRTTCTLWLAIERRPTCVPFPSTSSSCRQTRDCFGQCLCRIFIACPRRQAPIIWSMEWEL